ncbi:MAG: VWA domain-containing protein [Phycisphaerae bacterium]|nr:VWA domain-containing protein [Phycisphaerae bacterium]
MGLAWRHPHSSATDAKVWAVAWPVSLAIHLLAFVILYFIFTPAGDPLAESNAIGQLRFADPSEALEDRPLIRSHSAPSLSSLLDRPAVRDLPLSAMPTQLVQDPRVIGLSSGQNLAGPLAVFSTAPQPAAPRVSFFGSSAAGYKIVFVVDRSGSMWDQFEFVRNELLAALARLEPSQQFQLIFFSSGEPLLMEPSAFLVASPAKKRMAYDFLQKIARLDPPSGPTDPAPALNAALSLPSGPADVIFLLTDGDFPPSVLDAVKSANPRTRTQINAIGFGYQGGADLLRRLAAQNRGSFRFVQNLGVSGQPAPDFEVLMP